VYVYSNICVILGYGREVEESCAFLGHYAASSGSFVIDVSGQPVGPIEMFVGN
jgi:hypothetical protein